MDPFDSLRLCASTPGRKGASVPNFKADLGRFPLIFGRAVISRRVEAWMRVSRTRARRTNRVAAQVHLGAGPRQRRRRPGRRVRNLTDDEFKSVFKHTIERRGWPVLKYGKGKALKRCLKVEGAGDDAHLSWGSKKEGAATKQVKVAEIHDVVNAAFDDAPPNMDPACMLCFNISNRAGLKIIAHFRRRTTRRRVGAALFRLIEALPDGLHACVDKLCAGAAFCAVAAGQEHAALAAGSLPRDRLLLLSTALGEELGSTVHPIALAARDTAAAASRLSLETLCLPVSAASGVEFANALGAYAASVVELLAPRLASGVRRASAIAEARFAARANCGHELPNVAAAATDAWVKFYGALPADFAPPWRRAYATHVRASRAARASSVRPAGTSFEDGDDAHFNRSYHAGPAIYELAIALQETDLDEAAVLAAAPWLEATMEAVFEGAESGSDSD
ncbi:hypothetical protein JL721_12787 [Aureococcus anophagefferens]|nr:hypothetical protein JL721_12787 [Aureococcus anophagefferens]